MTNHCNHHHVHVNDVAVLLEHSHFYEQARSISLTSMKSSDTGGRLLLLLHPLALDDDDDDDIEAADSESDSDHDDEEGPLPTNAFDLAV